VQSWQPDVGHMFACPVEQAFGPVRIATGREVNCHKPTTHGPAVAMCWQSGKCTREKCVTRSRVSLISLDPGFLECSQLMTTIVSTNFYFFTLSFSTMYFVNLIITMFEEHHVYKFI